ncbi:MAG: aminoacyl-tRNA hydrolase [Acholeplasmataceae bacterium]|nr:aminoacyl-tRNA hydrolase [Acholeplasmataceae bacterium]
MKLIIGLGNPGSKYQKTRHNIGFMVIDDFIKKHQISLKFDAKFNAETAQFSINGEKVYVMKPSTYMNLSGEAVLKFVNYYQIDLENMLVFVDDINLPTGKLRLRETGGHGGHNGLRNIIGLLKTEDFKRVRIGIDNNPMMALDSYVLGQFNETELASLGKTIEISTKIIEDFVNCMPYKDIMTKYNTQT